MIRLSLPLSQFYDIFRLDEPRVPQALDDRIYLTHDDALDRELVSQDVEQLAIVVPGASAVGSGAFSLDEDHYLSGFTVEVVANGANLAIDPALWVRPFGQFESHLLCSWDRTAITSLVNPSATRDYLLAHTYGPPAFPLFGRRETDYFFTFATGVGGGASVSLFFYRTKAIEGVRIAR